jgi:hypothetical protein
MNSTPTPPTEPTPNPFQDQKFKGFMRKLVAVPRSEIAAEKKKYQRRKARRAKKK